MNDQQRARAGMRPGIMRLFTGILVVVAVLTAMGVGKNLASHNFWFDEAGQFWLAMGQYHYAPAHTPDGSLHDLWLYSHGYIADPGGFTLLVRALVKTFGAWPPTLRLLPALFGSVYFFLTFRWSRQLALPVPLAIAIPLLFLTFPTLPYQLTELRPYTMELCGVVALGLATLALLKQPTLFSLFVWTGVDWFFQTSRYSFIVYSVAACGVLLCEALRRKEVRYLFGAGIAAATLWSAAIYIFMLRFQSASAAPPPYVAEFMLAGHGLGNALPIFQHNFTDGAVIGKSCFLVAIGMVLLFQRLGVRSLPPAERIRPFTHLACYILFAEMGWLALSLLGKMPWDASQRWSLSEYGLTALAIPALLALVWNCVERSKAGAWLAASGLALTLLCLISLGVGLDSLRIIAKHFDRDVNVGEHVYDALGAIRCDGGKKRDVLLDRGMWAQYRYLTERSGLPVPCAGKLIVRPIRYDDMSAVAKQGLAMPRPVTFLFGSWNSVPRNRLLKMIGRAGPVDVQRFGYLGFTNMVTLNQQ